MNTTPENRVGMMTKVTGYLVVIELMGNPAYGFFEEAQKGDIETFATNKATKLIAVKKITVEYEEGEFDAGITTLQVQ